MPNQCHVNVFARNGVKGEIDWEMDSHEKKSNGNLRFYRKNDEDGWDVVFQLHDKTGRDLIFPDDTSEALWVKKANDPQDCCKTRSSYPAFQPTGLSNDKTKLTVHNTNSAAENLAFTLRAIPRGKDQSKPTNFVEYDPIVENKNGGVQEELTRSSTTLLGALAAVAVIAVAIIALR